MLNARFLRLRAATCRRGGPRVTDPPLIAEGASSPSPAGAMLTWPARKPCVPPPPLVPTLMNTTWESRA